VNTKQLVTLLTGLLTLILTAHAGAEGEPLHYGGCWLKEADGRYFNPKGFVVVMEDNAGDFEYSAEDYRRMVRYGANTQVIRISIGPLAAHASEAARARYLERVDHRVRLAKAAGIRTLFKMTVYGLRRFGGKWESIYRADGENRRHLFAAWGIIWRKYAGEPSVVGFDLLNEPFREHGTSPLRTYEDVVQTSLIPLYSALIKEMAAICQDKWAIYQPLLVDIEDRKNHPLPCLPIAMPRVHDRMIFAPHGYFETAAQHQSAVQRHQEEVKSSGAALMMGEWGRQTYDVNDTDLTAQLNYTKLYAEIARIFDAAGMGLIKPWFTGTRVTLTLSKSKPLTWSVFSDATPTGSAERKYIMDVIARPFPLCVGGATVQSYGYEFTSRIFTLTITRSEPSRGLSEIYVPEDRHYPDGFSVLYNGDVALARDRSQPSGLRILRAPASFDSGRFRFDAERQRLLVDGWSPGEGQQVLRILPGIQSSP